MPGAVMFGRIPVCNPFADAPVYYADELETTMKTARDIASDGCRNGTVIAAGRQTAGRGRIPGRSWNNERGGALQFTLILDSREFAEMSGGKLPTLLPLLCGLAAAEAVERFWAEKTGAAAEVQIKWPNDLLYGGRKLCGILCESSGNRLYAGIGINLNRQEFGADLRRPAVSVSEVIGMPLDVWTPSGPGKDFTRLLEVFLERFLEVSAGDAWKPGIEKRLFLRGRAAVVKCGLPADCGPDAEGRVVEGVVAGINAQGALLLYDGERGHTVVSGEVTAAED